MYTALRRDSDIPLVLPISDDVMNVNMCFCRLGAHAFHIWKRYKAPLPRAALQFSATR